MRRITKQLIETDFRWLLESEMYFNIDRVGVFSAVICRENERDAIKLIETICYWGLENLPLQVYDTFFHQSDKIHNYIKTFPDKLRFKKLLIFLDVIESTNCVKAIDEDYIDIILWISENNHFRNADFVSACERNGEVLKFFINNPDKVIISPEITPNILRSGNPEAIKFLCSKVNSQELKSYVTIQDAISSKLSKFVKIAKENGSQITKDLLYSVVSHGDIRALEILILYYHREIELMNITALCVTLNKLNFVKYLHSGLTRFCKQRMSFNLFLWSSYTDELIESVEMAKWAADVGVFQNDGRIYLQILDNMNTRNLKFVHPGSSWNNEIDRENSNDQCVQLLFFCLDMQFRMDEAGIWQIMKLRNIPILKWAIQKLYFKDEDEDQFFYHAVEYGNIELLNMLLEFDFLEKPLEKPLECYNKAVEYENQEIIQWLLEHNFPKSKDCYFYAAEVQSIEMLEFLFDNGFECDNEQQILSLICRDGNVEICQWFVNHGFMFGVENLRICISCQNIALMDFLYGYIQYLDPNCCDIAIKLGNFQMLEWMVDKGYQLPEKIHPKGISNRMLFWLSQRGVKILER